MRALHLLGLRGPRFIKLRYEPPTFEPLVLPSWLPSSDREVLLAFYQEVLGDVLPRIEVDWDQSLVPSDARHLRHARLHHGPAQDLVVVRVRRAGIDLHEIAATPEIEAFQYTAIACDHPAVHETVGRLRELAELVGSTARDLYDELAEPLTLRPDGPAMLEPLVQTIVNPIPVLEAYNALIRVQGELRLPEAHRSAVYQSVLGRLLDDLPGEELVGLSALALRGAAGFAEALGERAAEVEALLRARMVILDGRPIRWARFLVEPSFRGLVEDRIRRLADPPPPIPGLTTVRSWVTDPRPAPPTGDPIRDDLNAAGWWIREGKIGRATEMLASLEHRLGEPRVTDETRGDFWHAVALLRTTEQRWSEVEVALRWSLEFLKDAGVGPLRRSITLDELACALADSGRWSEAEPFFREALRLKEEGGDTLRNRAITMDHLARGLRDNGRWSEAEPLFLGALRLKEEGGDTPIGRSVTMLELAHGLRDNDREREAKVLLREAHELKQAGLDQPTASVELRFYAASLRNAGRLDEARVVDEEIGQLESRR